MFRKIARILEKKGYTVIEDYLYGEQKKVELDIWVPKQRLAVEYQGNLVTFYSNI